MRRKIIVVLLLFLAVFFLLQGSGSAVSVADSFDPEANDEVHAMAIQADGKILAGGLFTSIGGVTRNHIARLNPDGTVDASFDPDANSQVSSIAIQADGKILAGGLFTSIGGVTRNHIARLNPDGTVDASFDPDANSQVSSIAVQTDGKILVGGLFTRIGGLVRRHITRLNPDGFPDYTFHAYTSNYVFSIAVQADGKILAGGLFTDMSGQGRSYLARLNPDGTLDASLDAKVNNAVEYITVQSDGKILVGGWFTRMGGRGRNRLARLNPDGTLDMDFKPDVNNGVVSVAVQPDGKILLGGAFTSISGLARSHMARLNADGSIDITFAPSVNGWVNSIAVQTDGKILAGGGFTSVSGAARNYIARLNPGGAGTYWGDGAMPDVSGAWAEPVGATGPDDANYDSYCVSCHSTHLNVAQSRKDRVCLDCHGSGINTDAICLQGFSCTPSEGGGYNCSPVDRSFCDKSSYLMTGHKNVMRRVTAGSLWAGADGSMYDRSDPYGSDSVFDWSSGTVDVNGTGSDEPVFYIFGGWMSTSTLNSVYSGGFTGELSGGGSYRCARCHTTGYGFNDYGPLPVQSDSQFSRVPDGKASITSSWTEDGIECERCHRDAENVAGGHVCYDSNGRHVPAGDGDYPACISKSGTLQVVVPTFENATALCIECHRLESVDSSGNIVLGTGLQVTDRGSCSDGTSPNYTSCVNNSAAWRYAPSFGEGSDGQEFLNSPHSRFTGALAQVAQNSPDLSVSVSGAYDSLFRNTEAGPDLGKNMGCTGCHDVHKSTVAETGQTGAVKECTECHGIDLNNMEHPSGPGTPLADVQTKGAMRACMICHMPGSLHLFRISVDADYSTFPTEEQFYSGHISADTSPEGDFTDAVWIDLDHACGQCHGGDSGGAAVAQSHGAPYLTTVQLSALATDIHNTYPTANFTWTNDGSTSYRVIFDAVASTCPTGVNCSYSWDFGDGGNGSGVIVSHQYADGNPQAVILTVTTDIFTSDWVKKIIIPEAVHQFPTCGGTLEGTYTISKGPLQIPAAHVDELVAFTDGSSVNGTGSAGVYINWGDGSAVSVSTAGANAILTHSYIWRGNYMVTQIVQDDMGYGCRSKYPMSISKADASASSGAIVITTDADIQTTYYVKSRNSFGDWVTARRGSFADGGVTVSLAPGEYEVYLYFADGHSCQWMQGQTATVTADGTTTVSGTSCK